MTQIAIAQPAAPHMPPAGPPPASSGSQQFSSHFEKAVANHNDHVSPRDSKTAKPDTLQEEQTPTASTGNVGQQAASVVPPDQDAATDDAAAPQGDNFGWQDMQDLVTDPPSDSYPAASLLFARDTTGTTTTNPALSGQAVAWPQAIASSSVSRNDVSPILAGETKATASATDTLLAQLQEIINNSDEQGTVTITRENTHPPSGDGVRPVQMAWPQQLGGTNSENPVTVAVTPQYSRVTTDSPHAVLADGWNTPAEKADLGTSLRQNTQQQYYEAKINLQALDQNEDSMAQDRRQGNEPSAQGQVTGGQTSSTVMPFTGDQTNTFAQSLATTPTSPAQPATDAAKTLTLPSGTVMREEDVIQQVLDRFHVSRKPLDTQINIKLHPAELGELKIDLTVKEGSIRANVVAQSQHAQEIIEKNMTKLRTVLEDQGFTVENITVSSKYDSTTDAGLFDRQLFSRNDYTPQAKKRRHDAEAAFRFDEVFYPAPPATPGVNVKI